VDTDDIRYRVLGSRDRRFDGRFFVAVTSTGIYCRPSCPAIVPKRENVRFYRTAAAAQSAGFRACLRCHPHAVPGSPEWNQRGDLAARAMNMIADGIVDREGVSGLARRLSYSERHLHRQLAAELGAGPLALARAQRSQTARMLIETADLRLIDVAHAAGFASVRQFNDTIRSAYGRTPTELRRRARGGHTRPTTGVGVAARPTAEPRRGRSTSLTDPILARGDGAPTAAGSHPAGGDLHPAGGDLHPAGGDLHPAGGDLHPAGGDLVTLTVRLAYRDPLHWERLLSFLATRAVAGVEEVRDGAYRRTLRLPRGYGIVELSRDPGGRHIDCRLRLADLRDLTAAVERCRRMLDLDADPAAADEHLSEDPLLAPLVRSAPGVRLPGSADGAELAVRAVLGQQVSVAAARTAAGRIVQSLGESLPACEGALTHLFPAPATLAAADPALLPGPLRRRHTLQTLAAALATGELLVDPGSDREEVRARLLELPGIGPWTAEYIAMRGLADPDAFPPTDLGVRRALELLGWPGGAREAAQAAERWRPWRAYALQHLWGVHAAGEPIFSR
jgi:AraC family transcriptional regulator, regulatory protein of adaptative response / DNA-3-methyladenine glycosylase II